MYNFTGYHCNWLQYLELSSEKALNNYRLLEFSNHPTTYVGNLLPKPKPVCKNVNI